MGLLHLEALFDLASVLSSHPSYNVLIGKRIIPFQELIVDMQV